MFKKLFAYVSILTVCLLIPCGFHPSATRAEETPRTLVLPFAINAKEDLGYLKTQISSVLGSHLEKEGATIIEMKREDLEDAYGPGTDKKRLLEIAAAYNADRVIWGSFSDFGDSFSLDARMIDTHAPTAPALVFQAQGKSLENLLSVTKELSGKIAPKLFKRQTIASIEVKGNQRIESDAILKVIKSKVGGSYIPTVLSEDLRSIFSMGYFDDLKVESETKPDGVAILFHVKEKPTIRRIRIKGNVRFKDEEIRENLTLSTGAILNVFKIQNNIKQIEALYKDKNYHMVKVDYRILPLENNQADIEFSIDEGPKLYVTEILFEGNSSFEAKKLKKEMDTTEKGFFYFLSSSGDLNRSVLDQDMAKLNAFYHNQGFIHARISEPQIDILDEHIRITIKISEGPKYKVGAIDISGELIRPKKDLIAKLSMKSDEYYSREKVRTDVITLTDIYGDQGYAYADVSPKIDEDENKRIINVNFNISKGQQVYLENILISGNTYTRDKVIRRAMSVQEQELFSVSRIKRSIRNLYRLEYFEDIKVNQLKGTSADKMSLKIEVSEKPTGTFSFGAGHSSEENFFLTGSISKRNFLGYGQTLAFAGQFGSSTKDFQLSFTEPWLMDTHLSATVRAYNRAKEYEDQYDLRENGGGFRFSYPIFDYTRIYWGYDLRMTEVTDVTDKAPKSIEELEGTNLTSSVNVSIGYDSRDRGFNTTEGSKHGISIEYAGLGGDISFAKYMLESGWYFPLFKGLVGFVHGKTGYVHQIDDSLFLPDYEKCYLGGINSIRGFDYRGIHLEDEEGNKAGAERMVQFNLEIGFPIAEKQGLRGVVFYDAGNVYDHGIDLGDVRQSAGYGIRWNSPFAPIRIEYGYILDRREDEGQGRWEFTMGGAF